MQPRTLCPTCSAPFPPDALKCSYCGTPSPLAYERQRVAQQVDYERQRFAQQVDAASRIQRMRANLQTAEQNANTGFLLSVASFAVCCLPVQLAGVFLGLRAMRLAKSEGVAAPTRAYLAVSVGALGVALVGLIGLIALIRGTNHPINQPPCAGDWLSIFDWRAVVFRQPSQQFTGRKRRSRQNQQH